MRHDQNGILGGNADEPGCILTLTPLIKNAPDTGVLGEITIGVDPAGTPAPAGFGGGPPPGRGPEDPAPDDAGERSGAAVAQRTRASIGADQ